MSGLACPFLITTTIGTAASGISVLSITLPDAITSSSGGCTIGTSKGAPCTTCRCVAPPEPMVALSTYTVFFSKAGLIRSIAQRMPPGATSVTSSARAACGPQTRMASAADDSSFFMRVSVNEVNPKSQAPNPRSQVRESQDCGRGLWVLGFGSWDLIYPHDHSPGTREAETQGCHHERRARPAGAGRARQGVFQGRGARHRVRH